MTAAERAIEAAAIEFAKRHRTEIARRLANPAEFVPEDNPVSVFMAGSPGAGKTEASIELLAEFAGSGTKILRIDPDDLRGEFPSYNGRNSWLFQRAVTRIVERIHDLALQQKQSFLLDGTMSSYEVARRNIDRSLDRGRTVQILYVYQEPQQAWTFVQAREAAEGRRIEPESFLDQYFAARTTVNRIKRELGKAVRVDLLLKNNDGSRRLYQAGVDLIDNHIPEKYSRADVKQMLGLPVS
jgi:UDP-N-acetylglucosamine kinase